MDLLNFLDGGSALPFSSKEVTTTLSPSFCLSPRFFPSPNLVAINSFAAANDDEVRLTNKDKKDDDDDHDHDHDGDDSDESSSSSRSNSGGETAIEEKASVVCSPSMHTLLFAQESLEASNGSMTGVNPSSVTPSSPGGGGGGTSIFAALSSSAQPRPSPSRSPGPTPTMVPTRSTPASKTTTMTTTTTTTTIAGGGSTRAVPMVTLPPSSCSAAEDPCGTGRGDLGGSLSCARSKGGVVVPITHPPSRTTLRVVSSPSTAATTAGKMASGGGREGRASRYGVGAAGTSTGTSTGTGTGTGGASSGSTRRGHGGGVSGGGVVSSSAAAKDVIVDVKPVTLADLEEEELKRARNRASAAGSRLKRKAEHESLKAAKDRLEAERLERERITTEALAENEALRKEVAYLRSLLHHASPLAGLLATLAPSSSALSSSSSSSSSSSPPALTSSPAPLSSSSSSSSSSSQCATRPSEGRLKRKYSGGHDNESGTPPSASVCVTVNASGGFTLETCSECSLRATGGGGRVAHQHGGIVSGSLVAHQHSHHHHHQQQQDGSFIKSEYFDGTKGHSSREEGEEEKEEEEEEMKGRVTKRARLTAHASSSSSSSSSLSLSHGTPSSG